MHGKTASLMKLTAYLLAITATGFAAWMFLRKGTPHAKLEMPRPKRNRPVHHKRNGMKAHAAH
jgi:hypothetical protein